MRHVKVTVSLCQFLIGNVYQDSLWEYQFMNFTQCQFLIGNVYSVKYEEPVKIHNNISVNSL